MSGAHQGLIGPWPDELKLQITSANDSGARTGRVEMMHKKLGRIEFWAVRMRRHPEAWHLERRRQRRLYVSASALLRHRLASSRRIH